MTAVTVTASCGGCDWTAAGPGSDWDAVQRQAGRHIAAGHPVCVVAVPATTLAEAGAAQISSEANAASRPK
jgi:hypothetical protein